MSIVIVRVMTHAEEQTERLGAALGRLVEPGELLALHGELGVGKTRLVRGLALGLGLDPGEVSSPTFVLAHQHAVGARGIGLAHLDAYRLHGADELESLGLDRLMTPRAVIAVEWPERVEGAILARGDARRADIFLEHTGAERRLIRLEVPRGWRGRPGWDDLAGLGRAEPDHGERDAGAGPARCPVSGRPVAPDSPTFPFFDERCRMADLGRWMTETYMLGRDLTEDDAADPDLPDGAPEP
ncbi:MAG TPA: tRNA (adenosine(37)-N6)-threonylcarbamoyltransferase complex ATPase subunit type 1 TsaE [Phycisphaerales bacterium]|nr:tRNA (adenosine(37)-N6)-threonylcarbamoyltransferase complex ATPase subunit type 1 TsaE [Phycisphaerales bacterium]